MSHNFAQDFLEIAREKSTNTLRIAGNLLDRAKAALQTHGCGKRDEIISAVKSAYDVTCKAVDIPLVPEPAESQCEQALWDSYIGPSLNGLADLICGPTASPPAA